ncbi:MULTISPECIES: cysteine--tRNA ligase [unclassified Oleiphilus]|uniref:cysteine--tRNA ligase n=1 Tax=unclassified Oleiphilus TaxID=2631174 RepID=UPI0007C30692|nr:MULTISPECIES: cysteine--tRNA ligase [unclassified Oleiphilus]KZZ35901.1 cysteine--tRNA ligase [Oleiphilus sp. HI0117]KZZ54170.1 cysteine--tRNA ligase [Oleiphilus sp. HI0123]
MSLKIYNTLSAEKEVFKPLEENKVKMYVCGMTVYDYCHIGHARVLVSFDVITRYLRHSGYDVTYIRNITDVDDKIFARAAENGEAYDALTQRFIDAMHEDEAALSVKSPDQEPRATAHIQEIIDMIQRLIDNEHAYAADNGDVYYAIDKFETYGKLSKRNTEELLAGARIDVEKHKRNPLDFVLWKAAKEGEASWESPWGNGRPGWHIECSAMSTCCLGDTFDIHGGGPDLKFPHHENEIAQSEGATGQKYVNYWMHAGAVRVNKEKMSKSLGNFFTIREVLEKYPAEVIRYFLVSSHYRSQVDYSEDNLVEAQATLDRLYQSLRGLSEAELSSEVRVESYLERFKTAMDDDFNTPEALAVMFDLVRELNVARTDEGDNVAALASTLRSLGEALGILQLDPEDYFKGAASADGLSNDEIDALVVARTEARANKEWAESDRIRDLLLEQGITLDDSKDGTSWRRS